MPNRLINKVKGLEFDYEIEGTTLEELYKNFKHPISNLLYHRCDDAFNEAKPIPLSVVDWKALDDIFMGATKEAIFNRYGKERLTLLDEEGRLLKEIPFEEYLLCFIGVDHYVYFKREFAFKGLTAYLDKSSWQTALEDEDGNLITDPLLWPEPKARGRLWKAGDKRFYPLLWYGPKGEAPVKEWIFWRDKEKYLNPFWTKELPREFYRDLFIGSDEDFDEFYAAIGDNDFKLPGLTLTKLTFAFTKGVTKELAEEEAAIACIKRYKEVR